MIVIGYQGIGKSTLARNKRGYIDLESSCFYSAEGRHWDWYIYYCRIAENLSSQGYVVFTSSHKPVQIYFQTSDERAICIFPSARLKDEWKKKLKERYEEINTDKNFRAWMNAEDMYEKNISELMSCGIPTREITSMDYDLESIIKNVIKENPNIRLNTWQIDECVENVAHEEIIQCKDCKHYEDGWIHCNRVTWWNGQDDYCSRAERRTDEETDIS